MAQRFHRSLERHKKVADYSPLNSDFLSSVALDIRYFVHLKGLIRSVRYPVKLTTQVDIIT